MEKYVYLRYKYRIYLNKLQRQQVQTNLDCCRFVHNYYLNMRSLYWRTQHRNVNYHSCANNLKYLKLVYPWLKEADSMALQEELKDLQTSFENFWEGRANYPQLQSKRYPKSSYRTRNNNHDKSIYLIDDRHICIPKLRSVRIKLSRAIPGKIENATIIVKPSGKCFISLTVKIPTSDIIQSNDNEEHGLDLGIHSFYTLDNGFKLDNPQYFHALEKKLTKVQRKLSRMKYGSSNYRKQKIKVARIHENIADIRDNFLHQESTYLAKKCSLLCIEDLNIAGMKKNIRLSKAISDSSWSKFTKMLEYKTSLHGGTLVKVPRFYASSQTCHICGHKNPKTKDLTVREWTCPVCGELHDRDTNAAINILYKGKTMLTSTA